MIKKTGHISGEYYNNDNLLLSFLKDNNLSFVNIVKVGIQANFNDIISFNNSQEFKIGKTGKLEFDNINIDNVKEIIFMTEKEQKSTVIIDFLYII